MIVVGDGSYGRVLVIVSVASQSTKPSWRNGSASPSYCPCVVAWEQGGGCGFDPRRWYLGITFSHHGVRTCQVVNISTMGSRIALIFQPTPISSDSVATSQEIFLFDAHPHAARNESGIVGSGSSAPRWISDTYTATETPIFKGPVYSTLPYRFTRMQIPHTTGFREHKVYLTHDGLFTY